MISQACDRNNALSALGRADFGHTFNGKVHRSRHGAEVVGAFVDGSGVRGASGIGDSHARAQHDASELAGAIRVLDHLTLGFIHIFGDDDACVGA